VRSLVFGQKCLSETTMIYNLQVVQDVQDLSTVVIPAKRGQCKTETIGTAFHVRLQTILGPF